MRGRKPKPTALKIAEGNPGKRPLPKNEPKPEPGAPKCPSHLKGEARKMWRKLVPQLDKAGVLTQIDGNALARYCQAYAIHKEAVETLDRDGKTVVTDKGNILQSPWIGIMNTQAATMAKLEAEFGMTPSSRSRVTVAPKTTPGEDLAAFMDNGGAPMRLAE